MMRPPKVGRDRMGIRSAVWRTEAQARAGLGFTDLMCGTPLPGQQLVQGIYRLGLIRTLVHVLDWRDSM